MDNNLKTKIDNLWQFLWNSGMANPLTNLQQITYLIFIKMLDDKQIADEKRLNSIKAIDPSAKLPNPIFKDGNYVDDEEGINVPYTNLRWSYFKEFGSPQRVYENMRKNVFPFIKKLKGDKSSFFAQFMKKANFEVTDAATLDGMIQRLSDPVIDFNRSDVMGDCYEILLSRMSTAGELGQFRTPRHIIDMMVELVKPSIDDKILDPAMGTAGFLIESATYIQKHYRNELMQKEHNYHYHNEMFTGFDIDKDMVAFGSMNVTLHGIENPLVQLKNSLATDYTEKNKYTLILANPPFKGSLDASVVSPSLSTAAAGGKKTELLFLALFLRVLQVGGRCASIVPAGVLFGNSKAHKAIRKMLIEDNKLEAVISIPSGVFQPYSGVSTAIILFRKTESGGTDNVWFYDMRADGYSLDQKRTEIAENDIPDIIARFENLEEEKGRARSEQSFLVPKEEIVSQGYDLSFNKYHKIITAPTVYPPTKEILTELRKLESEIKHEMDELEKLLNANKSGNH